MNHAPATSASQYGEGGAEKKAADPSGDPCQSRPRATTECVARARSPRKERAAWVCARKQSKALSSSGNVIP